MAGKLPSTMLVYDSSDILNLLNLIKEKKHLKRIEDIDLKNVRKLSFSGDDRVMAHAFDSCVKLYHLKDSTSTVPFKIISIPEKYGKLQKFFSRQNF